MAAESGERVALVTGASAGIGAAIAARFAAEAWTVGCISRRGDVPAGVTGTGTVVGLAVDVTGPDLEGVLADFIDEQGRLDLLVNCAGIHADQRLADLDADDVRATFEVNFLAPLRACAVAAPHLARRGGSIVNIGSFFDRIGVPGSLAYSASKAALASATKTMAVELGREGVTVLNVAPGYIRTDLNEEFLADQANATTVKARIPAGRVGEPVDVASLVAALVLANAGFCTGTTVYVDGGEGIAL